MDDSRKFFKVAQPSEQWVPTSEGLASVAVSSDQ
jgi:hypothetical protein